MLEHHPTAARVRAGRLPAGAISGYLGSVHSLLLHTVPHLRRARERAELLGFTELAEHFSEKVGEEASHHRWAEDDLRHLGETFPGLGRRAALPAIGELTTYLEALIDEDPRLYLVYASCNEYFMVVAGPPWMALLHQHCGVPFEALTVIGKHVQADQHHAVEGLEAVERLAGDPALQPRVLRTVDDTLGLFSKLFDQMADAA